MVAIRVIDDHFDLENVGVLTHSQIDTYFSASLLVASGTNSPSFARVLSPGPGVFFVDNGPGSTFEISVSGTVATQVQFSWNEIPTGSIDGINRTFLFSRAAVPQNAFMLFLNGVKQREGSGSDFVLSGSTVLFAADNVPRFGANIDATYQY